MTIEVIYGSTRAHGNTELLTERAIEGLLVERIYLLVWNAGLNEELQ